MTAGRPELTQEFLFGWHDDLFATAKRHLREDGHLSPVVWMLTYPELIPSAFRGKMAPLGEAPPTDAPTLAIVALPISYGYRELHQVILDHVMNEEGRKAAVVAEHVIKRHPDFSEEKMHRIMVQTALKQMGWVEADLVAIQIRAMLKAAGALAYVKQDDAWTVSLKDKEERADHPASLADDPSATECIISTMEHWGGMRVITQPYQRRGSKRGEGKVKAFGDPLIKAIPRVGEAEMQYKGRFTWMLELEKAEGEPS